MTTVTHDPFRVLKPHISMKEGRWWVTPNIGTRFMVNAALDFTGRLNDHA